MDPISICLLAAGLVKQIQAGCELYKQAKESFVEIKATADEVIAIGKEVHGFWGQLLAFFGSKPKPQAAKKSSRPGTKEARLKRLGKYVDTKPDNNKKGSFGKSSNRPKPSGTPTFKRQKK